MGGIFHAISDVVGSVVDAVVDVVDSIPVVGDFADDVLGLDPNGGGIVPIVKGVATGVVLSPIGGFAGGLMNTGLGLGLGVAGEAALGGATIGAATGGVKGAVTGAAGGYIGSVVSQTLSGGNVTTVFDDGSQLVTDASGNVLSGVDIDGANFSVTNGVAHYADGSTLGGVPSTNFDNPGNFTDASGQFHDVEGLYGQAGDIYDSNGVNLTAETRMAGSGFTGPTVQTNGNFEANGIFHDVEGLFGPAGAEYGTLPDGTYGRVDIPQTTPTVNAQPTPVEPTPVQTTVPTTTVPPTSNLGAVAPGVSPVATPPSFATSFGPNVDPGAVQHFLDLGYGQDQITNAIATHPNGGWGGQLLQEGPIGDFADVPNIDINGVGTNPADAMNTVPTTTIPPTSDLSQPAPGVNTGVTPVEPTPVVTQPTTTVTYDDGSTMTYNTETGVPVSGADTTGATFTVNPTTGVATYDATGAQLGGTPNTNFGGGLANPSDVQNLLDYNAGLPPVVDNSRPYDETTLGPLNDGGIINLGGTNIPDVVTGIVAGGVLVPPIIDALTPPTTPKSPYEGQTFTPASPGSQWSGKLVNANMIPSYVGRVASMPYYNTTSPVQAQYYWGAHPYIPLGEDLAQYNNIPEAPTQPWGLQRGFFEGAQPNYQPVVYGQNMNPVNPGSTIG